MNLYKLYLEKMAEDWLPEDKAYMSARVSDKARKATHLQNRTQFLRPAAQKHDFEQRMIAAGIVKLKKPKLRKHASAAWTRKEGKDSAAVSYHGSTKKFDKLRAGSWVTPHKEDARSFAVPWDSKQLAEYRSVNNRPPKKLKFKPDAAIPDDSPIYIYKIKGKTIPAKTNTDKEYSWNKQVTEDTPVTLVEQYPSWKKYFGIK